MLLGGCVSEPVVKVTTPRLAAPPVSTIDALEHKCKVQKDAGTCRYIIQLEKHYEKLN